MPPPSPPPPPPPPFSEPRSVPDYELVALEASYLDARSHCEALDGRLASITSEEEHIAIRTMLDKRVKDITVLGGQQAAWIGLSDMIVVDDWRWDDGRVSGYSKWAAEDANAKDGRCAVLSSKYTWDFLATECDSKRVFVCEGTRDRTKPISKANVRLTIDIFSEAVIPDASHENYSSAIMNAIVASLKKQTSEAITSMVVTAIFPFDASQLSARRHMLMDDNLIREGLRFDVTIGMDSASGVSSSGTELMMAVYSGTFTDLVAVFYPNIIASAMPRTVHIDDKTGKTETRGTSSVFFKDGSVSSKRAVDLGVSDLCTTCKVTHVAPAATDTGAGGGASNIPPPIIPRKQSSTSSTNTAGIIAGVVGGVAFTMLVLAVVMWSRGNRGNAHKRPNEFEFVENPLSAKSDLWNPPRVVVEKNADVHTWNPLADSPVKQAPDVFP